MSSGRSSPMLLVLIAGTEALLIALICTAAMAVVGQSTSTFTGATQWALYMYGGLLVATVLMQFLATSSASSSRGVSSLADALCSAAFLIFVYYLVFFLTAVPFGSSIPGAQNPVQLGAKYLGTTRLTWFLAAVGDSPSGWELATTNQQGQYTSVLARVGYSGTVGSVVGQVTT
jgi:hypothetical protein